VIDLVVRNASQILTCAVLGEEPPLAGKQQGGIGLTEGGVSVDKGRIVAVGPEAGRVRAKRIVNARGGVVLPGFVDCHTHAVFMGNRAGEFEDRARGLTYEEIARRGGGIVSTMHAVREASDKELGQAVSRHLDGFLDFGTTTIEAKSGYGLSVEDECRCLSALKRRNAVQVVRTCLAAHTVPPEYAENRQGYIDLVCKRIFPLVAHILEAGRKAGLRPRIHADQLSRTGGCRVACRVGAITADHVDCATRADAVALREAGVIGVLLPAANLVLDQEQRPPARPMIHVSLPLALATDFNPGTAPTQSMPLVLHLAVVRFKLTIAEAIVGATINAACAAGSSSRSPWPRGPPLASWTKGQGAERYSVEIEPSTYTTRLPGASRQWSRRARDFGPRIFTTCVVISMRVSPISMSTSSSPMCPW
jgi:imidazolonepropionase